MYFKGYRTLDREYADSTGLNARAALYGFRVSGPPFRTWAFDGLQAPETARVLDVTTRTVERDWNYALAWLFKEMGGEAIEIASQAAREWRATPAPVRGKMVSRAGQILRENKDSVAELRGHIAGEFQRCLAGDIVDAGLVDKRNVFVNCHVGQ